MSGMFPVDPEFRWTLAASKRKGNEKINNPAPGFINSAEHGGNDRTSFAGIYSLQ
jgi:hypothetical protein